MSEDSSYCSVFVDVDHRYSVVGALRKHDISRTLWSSFTQEWGVGAVEGMIVDIMAEVHAVYTPSVHMDVGLVGIKVGEVMVRTLGPRRALTGLHYSCTAATLTLAAVAAAILCC